MKMIRGCQLFEWGIYYQNMGIRFNFFKFKMQFVCKDSNLTIYSYFGKGVMRAVGSYLIEVTMSTFENLYRITF